MSDFWQAYLLAYTYWLAMALGSLGLLMLHHVVGGRWSGLIRRWLEAAALTMPVLTLLYIPLLFGLRTLYPWTDPAVVQQSELLQNKTAYLNLPFFLARAALYFVVWNALAYLLNRWSREEDRTGDPRIAVRLRRLSIGGLILFVLTVTFAAFDWLMSLEPEWYSSIYGLIYIAGAVLGALALAIIGLRYTVRRSTDAHDWVQAYNDLGNFMLALVMVWAYFSLSQFIIIWSANLQEEATWYLHRMQGVWAIFAILLFAFDFAIPFLALLARSVKRRAQVLTGVAVIILVGRYLDLYWLIKPGFWPDDLHFTWLDLALPALIGAIWLAVFVWQWRAKPAIPLHDPRLRARHKEGEGHGQPGEYAPAEPAA